MVIEFDDIPGSQQVRRPTSPKPEEKMEEMEERCSSFCNALFQNMMAMPRDRLLSFEMESYIHQNKYMAPQRSQTPPTPTPPPTTPPIRLEGEENLIFFPSGTIDSIHHIDRSHIFNTTRDPTVELYAEEEEDEEVG